MKTYTLRRPSEISEFCQRFPILYHAVPEQHVDEFETGILVFKPASHLRVVEDNNEGVTRQIHGNVEIAFMEEFFVFCMSKNKNINTIRTGKRALYQVNVEAFTAALTHSPLNIQIALGDLVYFGNPEKTPTGNLGCYIQAGEVEYLHKDKSCPKEIWTVKAPFFQHEQEIRICLRFLDKTDVTFPTKQVPNLTTRNPEKFPKLKIDTSVCFQRIG